MHTYSLYSGLSHIGLQPSEDPACDECEPANITSLCNKDAADDSTPVYCVIEPYWRAALAPKGVTVQSPSIMSQMDQPVVAAHAIRLAPILPICIEAFVHITCTHTAPQICTRAQGTILILRGALQGTEAYPKLRAPEECFKLQNNGCLNWCPYATTLCS